MSKGLGPRFLVEAGFIIAVAVVAGIERLRTLVIVLSMVGAWLVVAAVEVGLAYARRRGSGRVPVTEPFVAAVEPEPDSAVRVLRAERPMEPEPAPEPTVTPTPVPEPDEPPEPEPKPEPLPEQPRVLATAPPPARLPDPDRQPERVISLDSRRTGPREWNLWDLERLARERASDDAVVNEERTYLLMYLREFANADGVLPADFDSVVRESFGELLSA